MKDSHFILNGANVTMNSESATYEQLVKIARMTGSPSMTVRFRDQGGRICHPGESVSPLDGCVINCIHTNNA